LKEAFSRNYARNKEDCVNAATIVRQVLNRRVEFFNELRAAVESELGGNVCSHPRRITQCGATETAKKNALALRHPEWSLKQKIAVASRILARQGHGETLAGQVTCRTTYNGELAMYTQTYGKALNEITPADIIMINEKLETVEGVGAPNMATRFHLHVYQKRPDIQCLVHSHPLHTSALAQLGVPLLVSHMDTMALYDDVPFLPEWPGIPFGDEEGEIISTLLGEKHMAGLLAHHGMIVAGKTIEEATYRAYFFEHAAKMQLMTMAANGGSLVGLPEVRSDLAATAREWRASDGATKAHFYSWARQALKNGHADVFQE
jgi:L-fuculose-phosphate aldolase